MRLQLDAKIATHQKLDELLNKASTEKPRDVDIERLRRFLKSHPELWRQGQDLAAMAIDHFIDNSRATPATRELFRARAMALKEDLGWRDASCLERLLIDAVILAWLRWTMTELQHANVMAGDHSAENGLYWEKLLAGAQRQYLRACETLARVRKLARRTPELEHDLSYELVM